MTNKADEMPDVIYATEFKDHNGKTVLMFFTNHEPGYIKYARLYQQGQAKPAMDGWKLVPEYALKWLFGEGPDKNGNYFEPPINPTGKYWWRTKFRAMLSAPERDGGV